MPQRACHEWGTRVFVPRFIEDLRDGFISGGKSERLDGMSTATAQKILTDRINRIEVSATMAITAESLKMKAAGIDLADFGAGEPHFATPRPIKDAAVEAIGR